MRSNQLLKDFLIKLMNKFVCNWNHDMYLKDYLMKSGIFYLEYIFQDWRTNFMYPHGFIKITGETYNDYQKIISFKR